MVCVPVVPASWKSKAGKTLNIARPVSSEKKKKKTNHPYSHNLISILVPPPPTVGFQMIHAETLTPNVLVRTLKNGATLESHKPWRQIQHQLAFGTFTNAGA